MARSRRKDTRRTRRGVLVVLLVIAALGIILPRQITGKLINLVQVIVPFQHWSSRSTEVAAEALTGAPEALSGDQALRLQRENDALRHRLAALSAEHEQLQVDFAGIAGIRRHGLQSGRLIPARVLADDVVAWRESRLVSAGALSGVRSDAPVTSDVFTVAPDSPGAMQDGQSVLAGEVLVGFVEQVGTHTARVRLLTDRNTSMKVLIARREQDRYHPLDSEFWLVGTGGGLEVRDVNYRFVQAGAVQANDVVLTVPTDPRLPVALTVGLITELAVDPGNSLLYRLAIEPAVEPRELRSVYVVDVSGPAPD